MHEPGDVCGQTCQILLRADDGVRRQVPFRREWKSRQSVSPYGRAGSPETVADLIGAPGTPCCRNGGEMTPSDRHNALMREIMARMAEPLTVGADYKAVLALLESVIAGTILLVTKLDGDEIVLDEVMRNAKARLADLRLRGKPPAGVA
jgi:hypothetical protein